MGLKLTKDYDRINVDENGNDTEEQSSRIEVGGLRVVDDFNKELSKARRWGHEIQSWVLLWRRKGDGIKVARMTKDLPARG